MLTIVWDRWLSEDVECFVREGRHLSGSFLLRTLLRACRSYSIPTWEHRTPAPLWLLSEMFRYVHNTRVHWNMEKCQRLTMYKQWVYMCPVRLWANEIDFDNFNNSYRCSPCAEANMHALFEFLLSNANDLISYVATEVYCCEKPRSIGTWVSTPDNAESSRFVEEWFVVHATVMTCNSSTLLISL